MEKYQPSLEEIKKAEGMMSEKERELSEKRERDVEKIKTGTIEKKELVEQPIKNLLVVEDNEDNFKTAQNFFQNVETTVNVEYARDYQTAEKLLQERKYDGVITDLFFPKDFQNPQDRDLGIEVFKEIKKRLEAADKSGEVIKRQPNAMSEPYWPDLNFLKSFENFFIQKNVREILEEEKRKLFERMNDESGKQRAKEVWEGDGLEGRPPKENEQPLGVLVARFCKDQNIPYVIATSGHAAHGHFSTPVTMYLYLEGLTNSASGERSGIKGDHLKEAIEVSGKDKIVGLEGFQEELLSKIRKYPGNQGKTEKELIEEFKSGKYGLFDGDEGYETNLSYRLNPLLSDAYKAYPRAWLNAFSKLINIAERKNNLTKK